jgi:hypothetical protein
MVPFWIALLLFAAGCRTVPMELPPEELGQFVSREDYLQRLEPRGNRILHGAGPNPEDFADYWEELVRTPPALYATHFDLRWLPLDWAPFLESVLSRYPDNLIPQIGLSMTGEDGPYTDQVARGDLDPQIEVLCQGLARLDRPVFLRLGYGFNSPWTHYRPESYRQAWTRIVESIRIRHRIKNVAMVWGCAGDSPLSDYMAYYPGDQQVDWWGIDLFAPLGFTGPTAREFAAAARERGFPLMIGEAAPRQQGIEPDNRSWIRWFVPFFRFIRTHPNVKAFCYLSWLQGHTRIEADLDVLQQYRSELENSFYQHAAPLEELRWQLELEE